MKWFPSPHSGILFLCLDVQWERRQSINVSVPSFGDSFFIVSPYGNGVKLEAVVSVPSFGDSFFIINNEDINGTVSPYGFPSPHSGILFL